MQSLPEYTPPVVYTQLMPHYEPQGQPAVSSLQLATSSSPMPAMGATGTTQHPVAGPSYQQVPAIQYPVAGPSNQHGSLSPPVTHGQPNPKKAKRTATEIWIERNDKNHK